jgi:hypothetical protein
MIRRRWLNAVTAIGPSPQVQLNNTPTYSIDQAISANSNLDSINFKFALDGFKNLIEGQCRIEASTNTEQYFITELFPSLTLKTPTQKALHFVIVRTALINININMSTQLIKVNRISREIADIPASSNPLVFRFF